MIEAVALGFFGGVLSVIALYLASAFIDAILDHSV